MRWNICVSLFGAGLGTVAPVVDPCTRISIESACVSGYCINLFWVDETLTQYVVDSNGFLAGSQLTCDDGYNIVMGSLYPSPALKPFDANMYSDFLRNKRKLVERVRWQLKRFPIAPVSETVSLIEELLINLQVMDPVFTLEGRASNTELCYSMEASRLFGAVENEASKVSMIGYSSDTRVFDRFAPFASIVEDVEHIGTFTGMRLETAWDVMRGFHPLYRDTNDPIDGSLFGAPQELLETDSERSVRFVRYLDELTGLAVQLARAARGGESLEFLQLTSRQDLLTNVSEAVKLLAHMSEEQMQIPHNALLDYFVQRTLCANLGSVAELLQLMSITEAPVFPRFNHIAATVGRLCQPYSSAADRIYLSSLFKGPREVSPFGFLSHRVFHLRKNFEDADSDAWLSRPDSEFVGYGELVVQVEGAENIGYTGPRKHWIDRQIERYFTVGSIWRHTDEREQFITLTDKESLNVVERQTVRAAGRVMGYALKYDVAIGIPFAQSFIKALRIHHDYWLYLDELLQVEDPGFLANINWIGSVDWTNPPEAVSDLTFDGLLPDGDQISVNPSNYGRFVELSKEKKVYWGYHEALKWFTRGVTDVVGAGIFGLLTESELTERLVPSSTGLSPQSLLSGIELRNFDGANLQHALLKQWLEAIIASMNEADVYAFNMFVSGARHPPVGAIRRDGTVVPWIKAFFERSLAVDALPRSHTCHNELQIPLYFNQDTFHEKLMLAIHETEGIDGYAGYGDN